MLSIIALRIIALKNHNNLKWSHFWASHYDGRKLVKNVIQLTINFLKIIFEFILLNENLLTNQTGFQRFSANSGYYKYFF